MSKKTTAGISNKPINTPSTSNKPIKSISTPKTKSNTGKSKSKSSSEHTNIWEAVKSLGVVPVGDNDYYTHIDLISGIKYNVPLKEYGNFFKAYKQARISGERLSVAEAQKSQMPLVLNFNLAGINDKLDEEKYHIIVNIIHGVILNMVPEIGREFLLTYVMESDEESTDVIVHLPLTYFPSGDRTKICDSIKNALKKSDTIPSYDWHNLIDVENSDIPMYGSVRNEDERPKTCKFCFKHEEEDSIDLEDALSLADSYYISCGVINAEDYDEHDIDNIFHIILSCHAHSCSKEDTSEDFNNTSTSPRYVPRKRFTINSFFKRKEQLENTPEEYKDDEKKIDPAVFLDMWEPDRIKSRAEWKTMGEAIYNYCNDEGCAQAGLPMWIEETKKMLGRYTSDGSKAPGYLQCDIPGLCELNYYQFKAGRVTIENLAYIARDDDPVNFTKWHRKWYNPSLIDCVSGLQYDIAVAFFKTEFLDITCEMLSEKNINWFYFKNHRLVNDYSSSTVMKILMGRFLFKLRQMNTDICMAIEGAPKNQLEYADLIKDSISKLIAKMKGGAFARSVLNMSAMFFHKDKLGSFLDESPDLLCVKSGVLVSSATEIIFRPGRPQDFLTKETAATYREYGLGHPYVKKIITWAKQTFVDKELIDYWFKFLSSLLKGGNSDKIFVILYGPEGDNSKSAWVRVIYAALGPYCHKGTMSMLTNEDRNANGPSPLLVKFKATRIIFFEESEDRSRPMRAGFIKGITGSDVYYARGMRENGEEITPHFKPVLVTNEIPETSKGKAMKNRIRIIPFLSIWANVCPVTKSEQFLKRTFKMDKNFDDEIVFLGGPLLWMMVNGYDKYVEEGMGNIPKVVAEYTEQYWQEKDMYFQFTGERIQKSDLEDDVLSVTQVYEIFKEWYEEIYPKMKVHSRPVMISELTRIWGKPTGGKWCKIKPKYGEFTPDVGYDPFEGIPHSGNKGGRHGATIPDMQ